MCCPLRDVSRRKSDVPAIVLLFLQDVTGCYSKLFLTKFLHHPSESAGRSFHLCFIGMSASEILSDFVKSGGGGGCGGHTYGVLCTVWAIIGPGCSVVYMGHSCSVITTPHQIVWW